MITKPSIAGYGLNWQHCSNMYFCGLSDSYEQYYQAIRRCWRFGQRKTVNLEIVLSTAETAILKNIQRKEREMNKMSGEMIKQVKANGLTTKAKNKKAGTLETNAARGRGWQLYLGDCVEVMSSLKPDSIDYSIFSPPFASLYTYTDSERDMGNCNGHEEFNEHFKYAVEQMHRITKPGRLLSFHCMNLPISKQREGYIGVRDFRGILIRMFEDAGFIFHSEVCIWKDPVTAMQRTKAIGLLYKQLKKDSALSRQGIPDYLVTMRKKGENTEPVTKDHKDFPVKLWQNYASPVWMDINPSNTLQFRAAREQSDERHICPLQLDVIKRGIELWTNPGDTVFSPFAGIGSEGYMAMKLEREFVGAELKKSYWELAVKNINQGSIEREEQTLFANVQE